MSLVIDASVIAAVMLPDEDDTPVKTVMTALSENGGIAPFLMWGEVRNLVLMAERRGRIDQAGADAIFDAVAGLPIIFDHDPEHDDVVALARRHRLTIYDALYLELAARRDASLATLDRALRNAARDEGLLLPD